MSEVAFFSTLIVAYVIFLGKDAVGPTPAEALSLPLVIVHHDLPAVQQRARSTWRRRRCERGDQVGFLPLVGGHHRARASLFLLGTAYEWYDLIVRPSA